MKITRIRVFQTNLPYVGGSYAWGRGNAITVARASVVVLDTDAGLSGCGEFTPCGENYMVAHSEGVPALVRLIGSELLDRDPRDVADIEQFLDNAVRGHGYAKAPIDAACWDILGQSLDAPLWRLWGGKLTEGAPMYRVIPQKPIDETLAELEAYRTAGYRQFQLKAGADYAADIERIRAVAPLIRADEDLLVDANQGWRVDEAVRVVRATRDLDYILEQPCQTYEECLQVRRSADRPMKLDECITGLKAAQQVIADRSAEIVCLKLSNLGGLTKGRKVRDLLVENRIPVVAEDTWGGEITTAVLAHFASNTPPMFLKNTTDLHNYNKLSTGTPGPRTEGGKLFASDEPGLGVRPDWANLGDPVVEFGG